MIMANMGYPVVTRLGINQTWYNQWSPDKNYPLRTQQFNLTKKFLKIYLTYGIMSHSNIFIHEYWYNKKFKFRRTLKHYLFITKYFRQAYLTDHIVGTKVKFLIRKRTFEYFPMRYWFYKYFNWVIILVKWFVPNKFSNQKYYRINVYKAVGAIFPNHTLKYSKNKSYYKRFNYFLKFIVLLKNYNLKTWQYVI
uniref:Ribosomal protein S3a n=1 Tax=Strombidium sp. TaxID=181122 RepID=A0A7T0M4N2_9SPIT|nr:ribosomal protein S3a [Strombidium sp.]